MQNLAPETINQLRHDARSVVRELGLLNDAYFEIGVTLAERHLLIELSASNTPTMGEIAERFLLDKSTISRLISKAVKKNYIQCITDEKDKRKRFLKITEKGTHVLNAFEPIAFQQTKEALLTLTDAEVQTVYRGVALYAKGLKNSRLHQHKNDSLSVIKQEITGFHDKNCQKIESLPDITKRLGELGYHLEPFDSKDEEGLHQIFQEVVNLDAQFLYECGSTDEFKRHFFPSDGQVYVCRTLDGKVIGGFYLRSNFPGRANHIANAAYMVRDSYRGKGIGSLLVKASLHLAKALGFQAMQFNMVFSRNTHAIKLYKKLKFNIIGTLPKAIRNPDGSYQDSYILHRNLDHLN